MPAKPTFAPKDYHRPHALSLLCSEWEEVGHVQIKHQLREELGGSLDKF
jgi:hypothetical protein